MFVSGAVRASLVKAFPQMDAPAPYGPAACRLVAYLAFGSWVNASSGRLILGNATLADIAGASLRADGRWKRGAPWACGKDFVKWARTWNPGLSVTSWQIADGLAREVRATGIPAELAAAIAAERLTPPAARKRPVHLVSGLGHGKRVQERERAAQRLAIDARAAVLTSRRAAPHLSTRVLALTNGASATLLRSAISAARLADAYDVANGFAEPAQRQTAAHLDAIAVSPKQLYHDVLNSTRIYPDGPGLNGLHSEPREVLLADLFKVDWAKAQFAINARLYDIQPVQDALASGGIKWKRFTDWLGLPHTDDSEALVKRATYALNYCAGDAEIIGILTGWRPWLTGKQTATGLSREQAARFLDEPLIRATRAKMNAAREKVNRSGGARDAFGDWIDLAKVAASLASQPHKKPVNSVLAQVAQSWEVELQRPLIETLEAEASKARPKVSVAVWLWDGAYLAISDRAPERLAQIKRACDRHAAALGIASTLEIG